MDGRIGIEKFVEFVAPAAPVGAELKENGFVIFFSLFDGRGELLLAVGGFVVDSRPGCVRIGGGAETRERSSKEQEETEREDVRRTRLHNLSFYFDRYEFSSDTLQ